MRNQKQQFIETAFKSNEFWYGGIVDQGQNMPFDSASKVVLDLSDERGALDQSSPFLLSTRGRYIWSEKPFKVVFDEGKIICEGTGEIILSEGHENLRGAYLHACSKYFPPSGEMPDDTFFSKPQYNTWIELQYDQTQEGVMNYAKGILEHGMPPGILMIDDGWSDDYGVWTFRKDKFPDPKSMVKKLHEMGFQVMLWVIPVVSPDSCVFRKLKNEDLLLKNKDGSIAIREWWNGYSAVLDISNPKGREWFQEQLNCLQNEFEIDGFKFDGGDAYFYKMDSPSVGDIGSILPQEYTRLYNQFALQYSFNELRAAYKFAGQGLVTRLQDKRHSWNDCGINCLIPNSLVQSLLGYMYHCPDMIGGGDVGSDYTKIDEELIVRYAQVSAFMPMMQFSLAPWRVLSERNLEIVRNAALLHTKYGDYILKCAQEAAKTGRPIIRHMAFAFPEEGFEKITDQFMLGEKILAAPIWKPNTYKRKVKFPEGVWKSEEGILYQGGCEYEVEAPIEKDLYFEVL